MSKGFWMTKTEVIVTLKVAETSLFQRVAAMS